MRGFLIPTLATALLGAVAVAAGWSWLKLDAGRRVEERGRFPAAEIPIFRPALPGELTTFEHAPLEELPGSWPCFRGPDGDGVSREEVALAESWPEGGPPRLWSVELGEGYAGAAIHRGRVYVIDYDEGSVDGETVPERRGDALRCFSLATGEELWRRWYHLPMVRSHGISRTVPAVTDEHVVSLGPMGHVLCLAASTGEAKWSLDLVAEFGTLIPEWYAGQCPRIDQIKGEEVAILAPGGDQGVMMLAVKCASGEVLWKTPNPRQVQMSHASIARMDWHGKDTYVWASTGGAVGVSAKDGQLLWEFPEWMISPAVVPTPVILPGNRVLLSGGYKAGSVILEIAEDPSYEPEPRVIARLDPRTIGAEQQTPVCFGDQIYVVLTRNAGPLKEQLHCLSLEGAPLWSSGPERRFELGPFMVADGKLLLMNDDGTLTLARASSESYEELAQARVLQGHESWAPMAIAGGLLVVRDLREMICLDLSEEANR